MKGLLKKLRERRGASLVFALLIFLMCALAGTLALTAASANVGRYTHLEAEQRDYLSVASALELIQKEMDDLDGPYASSVTVQYVKTEKWHYKPGETTLTNEVSYTLALTNPASITPGCTDYEKLLLQNYVPKEWYDNSESTAGTTLHKSDVDSAVAALSFPAEEDYSLHLEPNSSTPDPAWKDSLRDVVVKIDKAINYTLTMKFKVRHEEGTEVSYSYPITVTWPGTVRTDTETEVVTTGDPGTDTGTRTTTTTLTCSLVWAAEDRAISAG